VIEAGAANNAALSGAWVPALVFGIPGDAVTAIAVGVLIMKGLNPGPQLFETQAPTLYAIYLIFILANLLLLPLGWLAIRLATPLLRIPRHQLSAVILMFCILGSYAINNSSFDIGVMLVFGVMVALAPPTVHYVPLEKVTRGIRRVPTDCDTIRTARDLGIGFGD